MSTLNRSSLKMLASGSLVAFPAVS